jgi:hydroxymethylpyrimidine/phosphomethylpyrimidine kinase
VEASDADRVPVALSIAGSDSGGGAGIQADLKAFAICGVHGTTAITAITAQNTLGVSAVHQVPGDVIVAQVRAVAEDIGVDAVKIGMLGDAATIEAVAVALESIAPAPVVLDPVMISESGSQLLDPDAIAALKELILSRATVATPNLAEARKLTGLDEDAGQEELARAVHALGPEAAIVTGGHTAEGIDLLIDSDDEPWEIPGPLHPAGASHGSGCTHSSVIAALLARGERLPDAAYAAREITADAVGHGLRELGGGAGPVDVFGLAVELED